MSNCDHKNWKLRKKATDKAMWPEEWRNKQILECRDCNRVWME